VLNVGFLGLGVLPCVKKSNLGPYDGSVVDSM